MKAEVKNTIGARIKARRTELGYTQEQFAEVMNTTKGTICKYEKDDVDLKMSIIFELATALHTSVEYLVSGGCAADDTEGEIVAIIQSFSNPELKKAALAQLKALAVLDI